MVVGQQAELSALSNSSGGTMFEGLCRALPEHQDAEKHHVGGVPHGQVDSIIKLLEIKTG